MPTPVRVLALYETGGHHVAFTRRAMRWLADVEARGDVSIDAIHTTDAIDDAFLSRYALFLQLDYPPYGWSERAAAAFERYVVLGTGGWLGFHHASLVGEFDGCTKWEWFSRFLGGIAYADYIPSFAYATVNVEDPAHPVTRGVPASFQIEKEEWYTYDRSPRSGVHVLASVDEATYSPDTPVKMGDHPVVWTNPAFAARNIYIFMGHSPDLFDCPAYTTLFRNALLWTAGLLHPGVQ